MFQLARRPQLKAAPPPSPLPHKLKPPTPPASPMPSLFTGSRKQKKGCSDCDAAKKPMLERPPTGAQNQTRRGSPSEDPAERQADDLGKRIGDDLPGTESVGHGPLPKGVQQVAESHLGVSLEGVHLDAGSGGQRKARDESALAVTEGRNVAFGEGQLSTSSAEGRSLLGHELVHVGQQGAVRNGSTQRKSAGASTVCPPATLEAEKKAIGALDERAISVESERAKLAAKLATFVATPADPADARDTAAQRQKVRDDLASFDRELDSVLAAEIKKIDAALASLDSCADDDAARKERDALLARRRMVVAAQRRSARAQINLLRDDMSRMGAGPGKDALGARLKVLSEFLSRTATARTAAGTAGKSRGGRLYVVHANEVRVGGSAPWRNNNPGNVQRSPEDKRTGGRPAGAIGVDAIGHWIFSTPEYGFAAMQKFIASKLGLLNLFEALRRYVGGIDPDNLPETCPSPRPPTCVTRQEAINYATEVLELAGISLKTGKVTSYHDLEAIQKEHLLAAMKVREGARVEPGKVVTCADAADPTLKEFTDLLGCNE